MGDKLYYLIMGGSIGFFIFHMYQSYKEMKKARKELYSALRGLQELIKKIKSKERIE